VPDIKAVLARVPAVGGAVVNDAHYIQGAGTWIAMTTDPDGHGVELLQRE
jgi:predicted enzyme related to lactoylglutathione lyase